MQDKAGMLGEPSLNFFMSVSSIVIQNQVQSYGLWEFLIQSLEEFEKLLMSMSWITLADNTPFHYL